MEIRRAVYMNRFTFQRCLSRTQYPSVYMSKGLFSTYKYMNRVGFEIPGWNQSGTERDTFIFEQCLYPEKTSKFDLNILYWSTLRERNVSA